MDSKLRFALPLVLTTLALLETALVSQEPAADAQQESDEPSPAVVRAPARPTGGAAPSDDAFEMGSPPRLAGGLTEEDMWPAASAEGWRRPVLVPWQRTFDDALLVARAQNRPILVAVNMDGEIASEHFAGIRYRSAETAALLEGYVCIMASVYRHTPRDYDEEGRRIECPRFETVTCGEHIQAERDLYDMYFEGTRVAPRHIVLDLEGAETYDVYYAWNTATVFETFRKGIEGWPVPVDPIEPTLFDLVKSADVKNRESIERAYAEGDRDTKRALLESLITEHVVDQVEVLRAAIFGLDLEFAALARRALAECDTEGALDLMAEALMTPLAVSERKMLLETVARLGENSPRAATLAALHSGLSSGSRHIDTTTTGDLVREYEASLQRKVDVHERAEAVAARPTEPRALLELAEALLASAQRTDDPRYARFLFADARSAAADAARLGAIGPRLEGILAVAAAELGDRAAARRRAVAAVEGGLLAGGEIVGGETAGLPGEAKVLLLRLFAEVRQHSIRQAYRAGETWPPEWLSDVKTAYASIAEYPTIDVGPLVEYHDFLRWIGASPLANDVLDDALRRFPDSAVLHERLRGRLLWEGDPAGLERAYAARVEVERSADGAATQITWFAGYASLVAAEHHRRRGEFEEADGSYGRAIENYERNIELFPAGRDTCDHFIALGHAGRSRVALERGDLIAATAALMAALQTRPASAATPDGLSITPVATAKMLRASLLAADDQERARQVQLALDALDPALLEPPPAERPALRRQPQRGRRADAGAARTGRARSND